MKQITCNLLLIAFLLSNQNSLAQSLQAFIQQALSNNYNISIAKKQAEIANNNNVSGNTGQLPSVDLSGGYSNTFNNTSQKFADGTLREGNNARNTNMNLAVLANWTVFNGFTVYAKKDQLAYLAQLGELNTKFYIEQTISDIANMYHQLVFQKQVLDNYEQSLKISAFRLNLETKKKSIGAGKTIDFSQALVNYQQDSMKVIAQKNTVANLNIELNKILNIELEKQANIETSSILPASLPEKDSLMLMVEKHNKQLEEQKLQELIVETNMRMANAKYYPSIQVFGGYQYTKSTAEVGFAISNRNAGPTLGLRVNFNLYNGGASQRAMQNEALNYQASQLSKEQIHLNLQADMLSLNLQYQALLDQLNLAKSNVETSRKVYEMTEAQLKKGAINGYDFRQTQLTLLETELNVMQLEYSLKTIEISIHRLAGNILDVYL